MKLGQVTYDSNLYYDYLYSSSLLIELKNKVTLSVQFIMAVKVESNKSKHLVLFMFAIVFIYNASHYIKCLIFRTKRLNMDIKKRRRKYIVRKYVLNNE